MKKKYKIFLILSILISLSFLIYKIINKIHHKKEVLENIKTIPEFSFTSLTGQEFTNKNLLNKPLLFIYFNSECEFCISEAITIKKNLRELDNVEILFISFEEINLILKFAKDYKLYGYKNITFLQDKNFEFSRIFDVNSIPSTIIYNKNKIFLKKIKGVTKISEILRALNQND